MSSNSAATLKQAKVLMRQRKFEEALELLAPAIAGDPDNPDLHECAATAYFLSDDLDKSRESFQKVTRLKPLDGTAWINIGAVYNRQRKFREAAQALRKGLQRDKKSAQGFYNLGIAQKGLGQLSMAANAYREAIKHDPTMAEAHQNLGNVYLDMSNYTQALLCFRKAMEIRPGFERAKRGLAIAEAAIEEGRRNSNPFGRLVTQADLAGQKERTAVRSLTPEEELHDRQAIRSHTRHAREHATSLLQHLKSDLEPTLLNLNRFVSGGGSRRELADVYESFANAAGTARDLQKLLRKSMDDLREHDRGVREG